MPPPRPPIYDEGITAGPQAGQIASYPVSPDDAEKGVDGKPLMNKPLDQSVTPQFSRRQREIEYRKTGN